ncbi:hypothetical protein [Carboxydothermus hydrogenoformans]|uniref:Uncharacterized protein n=1 Tax=Carboxydothermus hydrogenoformans (strain ATCC BAA-161 / DSM 6008 / Z-2901) TaxID=246194 RepID=Q3ABK6_CARHZ|nr:hypothetical protein [Carboxydothermus hydrogenoformans]ABB14416.1 hypothetical protein CHY_1658 [Carboxydothermus hydrogenoformans Z-2901]
MAFTEVFNQTFQVEWKIKEETINVKNTEKEITQVRLTFFVKDFTSFVDNIILQQNLANDLLYGEKVSFLFGPLPAGYYGAIPVFAAGTYYQVTGAYFVPQGSVTADLSNYTQLILKNQRTGEVIATNTINGDIEPFQTDILVADKTKLLEAGDVLIFEKIDTGSGVALPLFLLQIHLEPTSPPEGAV